MRWNDWCIVWYKKSRLEWKKLFLWNCSKTCDYIYGTGHWKKKDENKNYRNENVKTECGGVIIEQIEFGVY